MTRRQRSHPRHFATAPLVRLVWTILMLHVAAALVWAAPHEGDEFILAQPDGSAVQVRVWGDEYYQHVENLAGYTLVRDQATGIICYALLAVDGLSFVSTGVPADAPPPAGLVRGLQLPPHARAAAARAVRERFLAEDRAMLANKSSSPQPSTHGVVIGLTLIIDFADEVGTVPPSAFVDYVNQLGYTGYGNNGSVRDYFRDVSGGALDYINHVPSAYLRAPQPKSYYEDPNVSFGLRARELVLWGLNQLRNQGHDFSQHDSNGDGYIDAINVFYAGNPSGGWSSGLWPHSWVVSFSANGVSSYRYQITNIGSSLRLSTFCHENGHMLFFWPDLYDYGFESSGVGRFCLMCSTGPATNPVRPCAYLRVDAGWTTPVDLAFLQQGLAASHADMNVFRVPHPSLANEYYLLENRQRSGRDASLPDAGLAIWHVDELGSNNNEQQTPSQHYLVTLVQADGRWDLENGDNQGDATDLWKAPGYVHFDPQTVPPARWWSGADAPIYIDEISSSAPVMTFNYRESLGSMAVFVTVQPDGLLAPWTLSGPAGFVHVGEGAGSLLVWQEGQYTLTWSELPGWTSPEPLQATFNVTASDPPVVVTGQYADPPFAAVTAGPIADAGPAAAVAVIDVDGDGHDDLHVVNDGQPDRLLRNLGGFAFLDVTPPLLADAGAGRAAAWADHDNNGELDVFLVRRGQSNRLLAQQGGGFFDVTEYSEGLGDVNLGQTAAWAEVYGSGRLDLLLVRDGQANVLYRNYGEFGSGYPELYPMYNTGLEAVGSWRAAVWCDHDRDGRPDVFLVNAGGTNRLYKNYGTLGFALVNDPTLTNTDLGQDAVWADFDNDGTWDLYLVNSGAADVLYLQRPGFFEVAISAVVSDDGPGRSVVAADFDNDGALDLYVAREGQPDLLLFGDGAGGFAGSQLGLAETIDAVVAVAAGDLDGDGGVDLYLGRRNLVNVVLRNQIQGRGHWLALDLRADTDNRLAVGAVARVVAEGRSQQRQVTAGGGRAQSSRILHFGLGDAASADSVIVTWPRGQQTVLTAVAGDRRLVVQQTPDVTAVAAGGLPAASGLLGIYPNPFNPATSIRFALAESGFVRLAVYGLDGRRIASLLRDDLAAGTHEVVWHGRDDRGRRVASGSYVCRLETAGGVDVRRLTLIK